ncbi:solute carrier family 2 member 9, like 1 [Takifugu flavidus]|nr:solute carrier family 2 member 9, like 1 [Takifugu flavidus]
MQALLKQLTRGKALLLIIVLGFGGTFQNGYHNTGLSSPSPFILSFINNSWSTRYEEALPPHMGTMIWSLIVSLYGIGALFGSLSINLVSGMLGRKMAVVCNACISIAAAGIMLASKAAGSYEMIIVARILYGFSAGLGQGIHQIYLAEISPKNIRGTVCQSAATFLSLGKLLGQFFGLSEILGREDLWNVLLCIPALFSVVEVLVLPLLPDSPRYLFIEKGDEKACKKALQTLWGDGEYREEVDEMLNEQAALERAPPKSALQLLKDKNVRWQLVSISVIICCNGLSGISAITIFSYDVFLKSGIPSDKIRYFTLGQGLFEMFTSIFCGLLIERTGRRVLLWGGYGVMSASMIMVTVMLYLQTFQSWASYVTAGLIILIVIFSGGPVGVGMTLNSELFVQSDRLAAFVITGSQRYLLFSTVGFAFPFLIKALEFYCFLLFACVGMVGCLYTFFVLPETKDKTLVEISNEFKAITICGKSPEKKGVETKL